MHPMVIAALISGGSSLLGSLLGGGKQQQPQQISTLTPQQKQVSGQLGGVLGRGLGRDYSQLQGASQQALLRALAVDPRFARMYGMMGLRSIQTSMGAVPPSQAMWEGPQRLGLEYLGIPMMGTYMQEPAPSPLTQALGAAIPGISQYLMEKYGQE